MADLVLTGPILEEVKAQIEKTLIRVGVHAVLLIDEAGNNVVTCGRETNNLDTTSLGALAAANFGATSQLARLIGEDDFSLLFHKGKKDSMHFARIGKDMILVTIFKDNVSLGLVRLRVSQLAKTIEGIFGISN